jgi:hypothetical protein
MHMSESVPCEASNMQKTKQPRPNPWATDLQMEPGVKRGGRQASDLQSGDGARARG